MQRHVKDPLGANLGYLLNNNLKTFLHMLYSSWHFDYTVANTSWYNGLCYQSDHVISLGSFSKSRFQKWHNSVEKGFWIILSFG